MPNLNLNMSFILKVVVPVLGVILTIGSAIFAMEDRYVSQKEAATSLQAFDSAIKKDLDRLELQILNTQKDNLTDSYHKQYQLVKQHPNDSFYKIELNRIKDRLEKIQNKIQSLIQLSE